MKLCIVQTVLPLYAIAFFNRIVDLSPDIDLVVLADIKTDHPLNQYNLAECRFKAVQLDAWETSSVSFRPGILRALRALQPDVVIFSGSPREFSQLFAMLLYRIFGRNFGVWGMFHRIGGPRAVSKAYYRLAGFLADRCLTYTRIGAVNLVNLGVPKQKVVVVGTAIDERIPFAEKRKRTPEEMAKFRQANGLEDKHVILQVVRLSKIKRPELLVQAAIELKKRRDDLVFVLIGDGEMKSELLRSIAENNLQESFRMPGAIYDEAILSRWYLCAEAFVIPTFIGLSAHHAMSYGLPVVTDNSLDSQGSEFEILAEGLNSMTYDEGDATDLARVLEEVISNPELHRELSKNAEKTIEGAHNLDNKTRRFTKFVRALAREA